MITLLVFTAIVFAAITFLVFLSARKGRTGVPVALDVAAPEVAIAETAPSPLVVAPVPVAALQPFLHKAVALDAMLDALVDEFEGSFFFSKVAGVTKRNREGPRRQTLIKDLDIGEELWLEPEPENRFDENAVRVESTIGQIGYLPAHVAVQAAPAMAKGEVWRCFVSDLTGWDHDTLGVNIALFHYDPVRAARPERRFERYMQHLATKYGGSWHYIHVIGLTKRNSDGSDRRELLRALPPLHQFDIVPDIDDKEKATKMHLCDPEGRIVGTLEKGQSRIVIDAVVQGIRWSAVLRECVDDPEKGFKPYVALLRLGEEASAEARKLEATGDAEK